MNFSGSIESLGSELDSMASKLDDFKETLETFKPSLEAARSQLKAVDQLTSNTVDQAKMIGRLTLGWVAIMHLSLALIGTLILTQRI